ncbi:helix-turn-helix domain-containing protein [Pseudomonas sp. MMS21-TM103]|nr:helix-turn-helix domain-containing protein [Pseudomonas sp. MMS21 TM103]MCG4454125.1 helix-turn-helix domain-containing protein [Pseudomonas sp. MMS21 TM103]
MSGPRLRALDFAKHNLRNPLAVEQLAEAASLSVRRFSREFRRETGPSPAKAVENLRVEAARLLIEQGRLSMDTLADETGFADRERIRRASCAPSASCRRWSGAMPG